MTEPLVSILMISYNNMQYLKTAIDSVLGQTYSNWELIISDDGSTDGAWELAQKLSEKDDRIKVYRNEKNLGIPKNRKIAHSKAMGDYVSHLDGDDILFPYSVATMVEYLNSNPTAMLAQSDSVYIDGDSKIIDYVKNREPEDNLAWFGWRHFGMYRNEVHDYIEGYNDRLKSACEDGDLFMQIAEKYPFIHVPVVLYKHRWHGKNQSKSNAKCETCTQRAECNYIRVWAKYANMDPITYTKLEETA